jgi:DNA-binding transcriptional regulator YdaS (Cro superfamily)
MKNSQNLIAWEKARDIAGGASAIARILHITPQAVSQWKEVPPIWVLKVEAATGVSRHELRADVFGPLVEAAE